MSEDNKVERFRGRVSAAWLRLRGFLKRWVGPPSRREIRSWLVDDAPAPMEEETDSHLWELWGRFAGFWGRIRRRVFRTFAGLLALVCVAAGVLLYSNVWYMNLILYGILAPNFIILLHYLALTRK